MLIFDFDNGFHLLLHLRMTGQLVVTEHGQTVFAGGHPSRSMLAPMPDGTTRAVIRLAEDMVAFFNDQRKFGRLKLVDGASLAADPWLTSLGPEPLSDLFTPASLLGQLSHHRRAPIKAVLLDQSTLAGLGNIYADEALHLARIHPLRPAGSLSEKEVRRLRASIREVLTVAINAGGTAITDSASDPSGGGGWMARARVFQRQGQPCPVCGTRIERVRVAGRGTNLCPRCQPPPSRHLLVARRTANASAA